MGADIFGCLSRRFEIRESGVRGKSEDGNELKIGVLVLVVIDLKADHEYSYIKNMVLVLCQHRCLTPKYCNQCRIESTPKISASV
jgi:hypothetical protein